VTHACNPSYQDAEIRKSTVRSQLGQTDHETLSWKNPSQKWSGSRCRLWVLTPVLQKKKGETILEYAGGTNKMTWILRSGKVVKQWIREMQSEKMEKRFEIWYICLLLALKIEEVRPWVKECDSLSENDCEMTFSNEMETYSHNHKELKFANNPKKGNRRFSSGTSRKKLSFQHLDFSPVKHR
jgi:hypothetical protein